MANIEENMDLDEKAGSDVSFTIVDECVCSDSSNESRPGTPVIPSFDDILSTIDNSLPKENLLLSDFVPTAGFTHHPENHKNDKMSDDVIAPNHDSDEKNNKDSDNCSFGKNINEISLHPASSECSLEPESICNELLVEDNIGSIVCEEYILQTDNNLLNPLSLSQKSDNFVSVESEIYSLSEINPILDPVNEISEIERKSPPLMNSDIFQDSDKSSALNFNASFCDMPVNAILCGDEPSEHSDALGSNKLEPSHSLSKSQLIDEKVVSNRAASKKRYLNAINVKPCKVVIKRLSSEKLKNCDSGLKLKLINEIPVLKLKRKSRLLKSKYQGIKSHELALHNSVTLSETDKKLKKGSSDLSTVDSISSLESLSALYETNVKTTANLHLPIKHCEIKLYKCDEPETLTKLSTETKDMRSISLSSVENNTVSSEVIECASLPLRRRGRPKKIEKISNSVKEEKQIKKIADDKEDNCKIKKVANPVSYHPIHRRSRPKKVEEVSSSEKNEKIANCDVDNLLAKKVTESSYRRGRPKTIEAIPSSKKKDNKLIKKIVDREEDNLIVNEIKESTNSLRVSRHGRPKKNKEISSFTKNDRELKKIINEKADTLIVNGAAGYSDSSPTRLHGRSKGVKRVSFSSYNDKRVKEKVCKRENFPFKIKPCRVILLKNPALNEFLKSNKEIDLVGESSIKKKETTITSPQKSNLKSKMDRSKIKFNDKKSITKHIQGNKISKKNERQEFTYLSIKPCQVFLTRVNIEQYRTYSTKADSNDSLVSGKRKKSTNIESNSEESDIDIISEKLSKKNVQQEVYKNIDVQVIQNDLGHQKQKKQDKVSKSKISPKSSIHEQLTSLKRESESSTSKQGRKKKKLELSDSHTDEKVFDTSTIDNDSENIVEIERNQESSEKYLSKNLTALRKVYESRSKLGRKKKEVQFSMCSEDQINCASELSINIDETPKSNKIVDKNSNEKNSSEVLSKTLTNESKSSKRGRKKRRQENSNSEKEKNIGDSEQNTEAIEQRLQNKTACEKNDKKNTSNNSTKSLKSITKSNLGYEEEKKQIDISDCEKLKEPDSEQSNEFVNEKEKSKQITDTSCEKNQSPSAEYLNDDEKSNPYKDEGNNLSFASLRSPEITSESCHEETEEKQQKLISSDEENIRIQEIYDMDIRGENKQELRNNSEEVKKSDSDQCITAVNRNLNNQQNNRLPETIITKNYNENIESSCLNGASELPKLFSDTEDGIFDKEQCNKTIDVESKCNQVSEKTIAKCDTQKESHENSQKLLLQELNSASTKRKLSQILLDSDEEQCKSDSNQSKENDELKGSGNDVTMETEKEIGSSPKPATYSTTKDFFKMPDQSNTVSDEMKISVDSDENQNLI